MAERNIQNKITLDTSEFDRAIKQLTNNLKLTASEIKLLKSGTEDYNKTVSALKKSLQQNQAIAEQMRQKYVEIVKTYGEGSKQADAYAIKLNNQYTKVNEAKNALENYKKASDETSESQERLTASVDYVKQALYDLAKGALTQVANSLVSFTKDTINVGSTFETSFANVKKAVSGSTEEMAALEKEIRQTATEKPISADTLASLYQMGGQLGISRENLKDFTTAMVDLQNTSDLTAESGATMIAQYANVTHLNSDDYGRFASTLSYLGSTTATTESTIMNLVSRLDGAGNQIGMTHQQMLALATAMGSVGISAESGGSALSTILSNIDVAVDKNNEDLQTWAATAGMSAEQFATLWKTDVMSAIQAVVKGMADTKAEGGSLNILLGELGINNIRQLDAMKKLAGASDLLNECVDKANKEWEENQFLTTATGDAYNTLESKTLILQNTFKELQMSIYDNLKEPLKEATTELTNFLKTEEVKEFGTEISSILSSLAKTAVTVIKGLITNFNGIASTIKAIMPLVATLITRFVALKAITFANTLIKDFTALKTAITTATTAQGALNVVMSANPMGLFATAISAVIVGLTSLCIHINNTRNELSEVQKQIQETNAERENTLNGIDSEYNKYESLLTELKSLVDENGNVKEGYQDRVNTIIPLLQEATGTEIQLIDNQIVGYKNLIGTLQDVIEQKRMAAKINAYQSDYEEALKSEDELAKKKEEAQKKVEEAQKGAGYSPKSMQYYEDAKKELKDIEAQIENNTKIQEKYNSLVAEQYNYTNKKKEANKNDNVNENETKSVKQTVEVETVEVGSKTNENATTSKTTSSVKETSSTTYQELLNQQKAYKTQLTNYVEAMKSGNSSVTAEMVEDTQSNLNKVESRIKSLQELMGDAVEDITEKANNAATKVVDFESDEENEISEDDELDNNENLTSSGVILGKGVVGNNAVEMEGAGKDAAMAYLTGYQQQQELQAEAMAEALNQQALTRVANEALDYQIATIAPENLEKYDATERQLALSKETSQAKGMSDYSYLVTNASTMVMNLAKQAAMTVDFEPIGAYICQGIARGIESNKSIVIEAVRSMMEEANSMAEDTEEIASPSKVFYGYGKYIDEGLANGIRDYANTATTQVGNMAKNIQSGVDGIKTNMTASKLGSSATLGGGNTNINYNFTQNNTSNKSLDTLAIYQESKSMLKRAIRNVYV